METKNPRIVIIGAGFGGLFVAKHLANKPVDVLLVDRNNFHTFTPLVYQVATCGLDIDDVAYPVRKIFARNENVNFLLGEVTDVIADKKAITVKTNGETRIVNYDYLVVAAGSETNYFGNDAIKQRSFGLKTVEDAIKIRGHLLTLFERAEWTSDPKELESLTTMVVVGGGATGLETAGALFELFYVALRQEYKNIRDSDVRVILVEMADSLLGPYPEKLRQSAKEQLEDIGVEVILGAAVEGIENNVVHLSDGQQVHAHTLIWATGVKAAPLSEMVGVELARGGRIPVEPTLQVKTLDNVYALGDIAYLEDENGRPYPQQIPVAQQQAKLLAKNLIRRAAGKQEEGFVYYDKGMMATIGRQRAVAWVFNRFEVTGAIAWLAWLGLHLITLMGFRNRLSVFTNWVWNYVMFDRVARIVLEQPTDAKDSAAQQSNNTLTQAAGD
jgi:NADH:ubiquinone reductase (H+-translocating)